MSATASNTAVNTANANATAAGVTNTANAANATGVQSAANPSIDTKTPADVAALSITAASGSAANITAPNARAISDILPVAKQKIQSVSQDPTVFKLNIDIAKLDMNDVDHLCTYLFYLPNTYTCLDLSECNLDGDKHKSGRITDIFPLSASGNNTSLQVYRLSPYVNSPAPFKLTELQRKLVYLEQSLNADSIAKKTLCDFLETPENSPTNSFRDILKLKFFSVNNRGVAFLSAWQHPGFINGGFDSLPSSQKKYTDLYARLNKLIEERFATQPNHLRLFNGKKGLFAYYDKLFSKTAVEGNSLLLNRIQFKLEILTWMAIILEFPISQILSEKQADLYSGLMQDILSHTESAPIFNMMRLFYLGLQNKDYLGQNLWAVNNYLSCANKRNHPLALVLAHLCNGSYQAGTYNTNTKPNEKIQINVVEFFNSPIYREGPWVRVVLDALLALINAKELSSPTRVLLVLHCQNILQTGPKKDDKEFHFETWSLLYTLLSCKLNVDIEAFMNNPSNIVKEDKKLVYVNFKAQELPPVALKEDILDFLYWEFLKKKVGLTDADKPSYEKHFNQTTHHLILAFRQNLDDEDDEKQFDEFIRAVNQNGQEGYRQLRYNETTNPHLQTVFACTPSTTVKAAASTTAKDANIDPKTAIEISQLKSRWSRCDVDITLHQPHNQKFKDHKLSCTDNYWKLLTWGRGINCLEPMDGEYKLLMLLLYGQHRLLLLRDQKGKIIAGCMLHLLLFNLNAPEPCLVLGKVYHKDRENAVSEQALRNAENEILSLFESVAATLANQLETSTFAFLMKSGSESPTNPNWNKGNPERQAKGLAIFSKQGKTTGNSYKAGLDGDMYDCEKLEHAVHGVCTANFAYRFISPAIDSVATELLPLFANESEKTTVATATASANAAASQSNSSASPSPVSATQKIIISTILDYFDISFRESTTSTSNASLHFEWRNKKEKVEGESPALSNPGSTLAATLK